MWTYPELLGPGIAILRSRWPAGAGGRSGRECRQQVCTGKCGRRGRFPCRFCRAGNQLLSWPRGMWHDGADRLRREKRASLPFYAHLCDSLVPPKLQKKRLSSHIKRGSCAIKRPQGGVQNRQQRARWNSRCWGCPRSFALLTFFRFWEFRKGCHSHQNMA